MKIDLEPDSGDWWKAPLHYPWEPHRPVTKAIVKDRLGVDRVWRCSCGAFGPSPWIFLYPDRPRYRESTWWQRLRHRW